MVDFIEIENKIINIKRITHIDKHYCDIWIYIQGEEEPIRLNNTRNKFDTNYKFNEIKKHLTIMKIE